MLYLIGPDITSHYKSDKSTLFFWVVYLSSRQNYITRIDDVIGGLMTLSKIKLSFGCSQSKKKFGGAIAAHLFALFAIQLIFLKKSQTYLFFSNCLMLSKFSDA